MYAKKPTIFLIVVAVIFVAVLLYCVPKYTPIELVLDAVKVDDYGNELGEFQIVMSGAKLDYLFRPSRIDVYIHPFDGMSGFDYIGNRKGQIETFPRREFLYADYSAYIEKTGYVEFLELGFSPDLKQWIIRDIYNKISYVASLDGTFTTKALITYFNGLTSYQGAAGISLHTTGAEMDGYGNIITEGNYALEAIYEKNSAQGGIITLTRLEIPGLEIIKPGDLPAEFLTHSDDPVLMATTYELIVPHANGNEGWERSVICILYTDENFSHFLIEYQDSDNSTRYFIIRSNSILDYSAILEMHGKLLS